jgi:predicted DNA binding CopG/RHH family protein
MTARKRATPVVDQQAALEHTFDAEERELVRATEADEWVPVADQDAARAQVEAAARATLRKTATVTLRLTAADLAALKVRAAREGLPYQTLIASVLHKYVTGQLGPVTAHP